MTHSLATRLVPGLLLTWLLVAHARAAPPTEAELDDLGLTALRARMRAAGAKELTGFGVPITQVETNWTDSQSDVDATGGPPIRYMPDGALPDFVGRRIVDRSLSSNPPGAVSGHATNMGVNLYGAHGIAPGAGPIACFFSNDWVFRSNLRVGRQGDAPLVERSRVQNHSWIGSFEMSSNGRIVTYDGEILARLDLQAARDNVLVVTGITHDRTQPLLGRALNVVSVGTSRAGADRPSLVAPAGSPSLATAWVSASSALLIESASRLADTPDAATHAARNEVLRAVLLSGATKDEPEFPDRALWARTSSQPLSPLYGAGELNVDHSHRILSAGQFQPGATTVVPATGWDLRRIAPGERVRYFFDVERTGEDRDLSITATWNRQIDPQTLSPTLADVDLKLYDADHSFVLLGVFDEGKSDAGLSAARWGNVEHLFVHQVPPGRYALEVTADQPVEVALAWDVRSPTEPRTVSPAPNQRAVWLALAAASFILVAWAVVALLRMSRRRATSRVRPRDAEIARDDAPERYPGA